MNNADEISQAERRRIMADERRMRTYHGVAASNVDDERGGRYAGSGSKQTVVGSSTVSYPQQPENSPWRSDPCPPEPPLGYSVDELEPVGEMFERASTSAAPGAEASGGGVRPRFRRRA
jgi:hypothetical protein